MFIPDPDFYPSRISDPGSKNSDKREGWKKNFCHSFLCGHKFQNIENYFCFEVLKKKIGPVFKELNNFLVFTQKLVTKLSKKNMSLGSRIRKNLFRIPDPEPGVKKAPDPGSGSATLVFKYFFPLQGESESGWAVRPEEPGVWGSIWRAWAPVRGESEETGRRPPQQGQEGTVHPRQLDQGTRAVVLRTLSQVTVFNCEGKMAEK
jgi:hypothetical protein